MTRGPDRRSPRARGNPGVEPAVYDLGPDGLGPGDLDPHDLDPGAAADPVPNPTPSPIPSDRQRAAEGGRWGVISGVTEQLGSMATTVVLARLLLPEDFGVVAAATLVLNLLFMVGNAGFGPALIKRRSIEEPVSSTTFWSAVGVGAVLTAILIAASPQLARLLNQPDMAPYVVGLAPLLVINFASHVWESRLLRELRFRWVYTADIANVLVYAGLTLALAAAGVGAWSMVIGRVAGEAVAATVRCLASRWWPRWVFHWATVREDLRFNRNYLTMQFGNFFTKNLDYWVVSRLLGAHELGIYYVAFVLPTILRQRMTWLTTEIVMPLMARVADERDQLVELYRDTLQLLCFLAFPLLVGVSLTARQVIELAFSSAWVGAIGPLRWLAVAAAIEATTNPSATLFLALGRAEVPSRMMQLRLVLMGAGLLAVTRHQPSLEAIAAVVAAATAASALYPHLAAHARLRIGADHLARWIGPVVAATGAMAAIVWALGRAVTAWPLGAQAAVLPVVGAAVYLAGLAALDRPLAAHLLRTSRRLVTRG